MSVQKFYYPQDRILEDHTNKTQVKYGFDPLADERFELVKSKVARIQVKVRENGTIRQEFRWVSLYKVTLGGREPFEAGIIANYESSTNAGAYRLLNDTDGVIDFVYDKKE